MELILFMNSLILKKKTKNKSLSKILRYLGKNKSITNTLIKFADNGLNI